MAAWHEFHAAAPRLAGRAHELLYQFGVGLGFLGTVDRAGGPRVHPLCPIVCDGELYLLVVPGPKCGDLERDGRFALHSFPCPDDEDAAYLTGRAVAVADAPDVRADGRAAVPRRARRVPDPAGVPRRADAVPLDIERCLVTTTTGHGDPAPQHEVWRA